MFKLKDVYKLLRIHQWYKNVIVFVPIIFALKLSNAELIFKTFLGFISLCLISSSYYIINDILDLKKDKHHPEKKKRPIASGKISISFSLLISFTLFILSVSIAVYLSRYFLYSIISLFLISQFYNFFIRKIAFLDIILISTNFVIRAISGTFIINSPVSYWVVLLTFFSSMFLVSLKRSLELKFNNFKDYRNAYDSKDNPILMIIVIISLTGIIVFFSIYSILYKKPFLLLSLPIILYICFSFLRSFYKNPILVRNPEKFIFKKEILFSLLGWLAIVIFGLYFKF